MRLSEAWLREWVDPPLDTAALAERLTMAGLEVDAIEPAAPPLADVVVAVVREVAPHPDADRLRVATVDDGAGTHTVVCGAPNVRPGLRTALARPGARLPGGRAIGEARIRGVASWGMLCSAAELGLGDDAGGILELPEDAPPGEPLARYLALDDRVLTIELTPNRGDCLSVRGVAREVAVIADCPLLRGLPEAVPAASDAAFPVAVSAPRACPVYVGRVIEGVDARAPTPVWMRERLRRAGLRSLGALVDITNYVMLELGQPLHAFDLARLTGGIDVRFAHPGERLVLLDGSEVAPDPRTLLITDASGPIALAGVMGGRATAVSPETTAVFLESAFFTPQALAGRARALKLTTDAAYRFERGVAFDLQRPAIERATELVLAICGGTPGPVNTVASPADLPPREPITLRAERVERLAGFAVEPAFVSRVLEGLGLEVEETAEGWRAVPPPARFDLAREADLVEEVLRVHGYDRVPVATPRMPAVPAAPSERQVSDDALAAVLVERGYHEVVTWSFVDPARLARIAPEPEPLALANPISSEMAVMRTTLWAGLLEAAAFNLKRQQQRVRLYEVGTVFVPCEGGRTCEHRRIGGVAAGPALPVHWDEPQRAVDFYDLKGDVEALADCLRVAGALRWTPSRHPALHPGQSATLSLGETCVGHVGMIHPALAAALELPAAVALFELELDRFPPLPLPRLQPYSKYPAVRRDLSVVVDAGLPVAELVAAARAAGGESLRDLEVFDVYAGEGIDPGKKSVALTLTFQGSCSTLTDMEVDAAVAAVVEALGRELGAVLRG